MPFFWREIPADPAVVAASLERAGCRVERVGSAEWRVEAPSWEARLARKWGIAHDVSGGTERLSLRRSRAGRSRWRLLYGGAAQLALHGAIAALFARELWEAMARAADGGASRAIAVASGFLAAQAVPCAISAWSAARVMERALRGG